MPTALGVFITGFSSILTGLNFIVTIHTMRAPGHDLVPAAAVRLGALRHQPDHGARHAGARDHHRAAGRSSASSASASSIRRCGGDPVLFQHLFWFYSHPAVYIMILPAMGVISELVACFSRKHDLRLQLRGLLQRGDRRASASWSGAITCSSAASRSTPGMVFSFLSFLVAIPSAIKVFNWTATLYQGSISFETPMLYASRLHRPVHDRRPDRPVPGDPGRRRPRPRHLLRRRALPLHHGGRHGDGLPRRHALLVAEDDRPHVSGRLGAHRRRCSSSSAST